MNKRNFLKMSLSGMGAVFFSKLKAEKRIKNLQNFKNMITSNADIPWKWSIEAFHYRKKENAIICELCPNACMIKEGNTGICRTRVHYKGKLYSIAYGNPCSINVDPIEKKPLYHFHPQEKIFSLATAGCNFTCLNCQNWEISQTSPIKTRNYDLMPQAIIDECTAKSIKHIAYTYAEPIVFYEYMFETAKLAHEKGIKNVMISNGYINEKPLKQLIPYIDAANINLKSFNNDTYKKLNGGSLQPVLQTLKTLAEAGVWLEITNLIVPGYTDDLNEIKKMCEWLVENKLNTYPLHFSRFSPMYKLQHLAPTPIKTLELAMEIAKKAGIHYVYIGNVPSHEGEDTFCPSCNKKIIERRGYYILENNIINNKCKFCNTVIAGVWS